MNGIVPSELRFFFRAKLDSVTAKTSAFPSIFLSILSSNLSTHLHHRISVIASLFYPFSDALRYRFLTFILPSTRRLCYSHYSASSSTSYLKPCLFSRSRVGCACGSPVLLPLGLGSPSTLTTHASTKSRASAMSSSDDDVPLAGARKTNGTYPCRRDHADITRHKP